MRKFTPAAFFALAVFLILSCASGPSSPEGTPEPEDELKKIYQEYRSSLILEGAGNYEVVRGDTLAAITKRHYGNENGYYFPIIMMASSDVVADPDLIEPGMKLIIPDLKKNLDAPSSRRDIKSCLADIANVYRSKGDSYTETRLNNLADSL
ncbi:MAG: LysM peptidoglycan-binding domain-containing protein [Treponema sp.]|jgi:LysM repeat protein|nr:LysM peptidoglycan-binding domain-containing protein [Treponema sp.]